ncbi:MAG: PH domain-containing protein [Eubacterium sp.]|nr:PH domain-containing protein [Eubacterium sp.]
MTEKPDKLLLIYIGAAAFILCAALSAAAFLLLPRLLAVIAGIGAAVLFAAAAVYLALMYRYTEYTLEDGRLTVRTGIVIKQTGCLYLDRVTVINRYSLPAGVKFITVHVPGGSAVVLTGKILIRNTEL